MKVKITTPSRLHFGLIDLNGTIGRIDGGLGVALNRPTSKIEVESSDEYKLEITSSYGYSYAEIDQLTKNIIQSLKIKDEIHIKLNSKIPAHVGLGSKTQLSLALSKALSLLNKIEKTPYDLARLTSRGGTSRIGLTAFERGGFIVDGGHTFGDGKEKESYLPSSASTAPPAPITSWEPVPDDWYFVVTIPQIQQGASGPEEVDIFQQHCPISLNEVRIISHIILMKILPAIKQKQIAPFGSGLYELQKIGFKKIEIALQDKIIPDLIEFFMENGAVGSGMSSFGPVTFALIKGALKAQKLEEKTKSFLKNKCKAEVFITNVNNEGAKIEVNKK